MLFDLGWSEILLIGVVALVVIGPKDLPKALRIAGYWVRKARQMSREFQSSIDQMIREAELDEMRQELKKATEFDIEKQFQNTVDPTGSLAEGLKPPELPDLSAPSKAAEPEQRIEAPEPAEPAAGSSPDSPELLHPFLEPEAAAAPYPGPVPIQEGREEAAKRDGEGAGAASSQGP